MLVSFLTWLMDLFKLAKTEKLPNKPKNYKTKTSSLLILKEELALSVKERSLLLIDSKRRRMTSNLRLRKHS
jgi:hypothetical protein